jgi:ubiquinone biosynthesis monooxygenase Coq7
MTAAGGAWLPGDTTPARKIARIIRVDHAGEYGAARIYAGQLAVLGRREKAGLLRHMADQEQRHLDVFARLISARHVRPSALLPLWHLAGFALGATTAALGERTAMACTAAVEEAIDAHYARQAASLGQDEAELRDTIEQFRRDELEHRATALTHKAEQAPGYRLLSAVIKAGCRAAITLSERL